ncbi:helix-turn-helix domain-containing protein [Maribacter luteus]|uniref:helix-turn-helix domain-containing protein n=1 Tax=Maribacter luteus TaxID=2594478 RepID=UPI0024932B68|nr:helix-turn-helix transcriptional regulator [Maribacter luteus]
MVNIEDFIKRLEKILRYYDLSASVFADRIKVQRSSISHLLSGRNKPSLEFVMKVVDTFPEVDLYWLLKGEGDFPVSKTKIKSVKPLPAPTPVDQEVKKPHKTKEGKSIDRIVIFFSDGSFKSYRE